MNLFLLRHGKAEPNANSGEDFDRKLDDKGRKQVVLLNEFFKTELKDESVVVFCSSAKRTQETFNGIKTAIDIKSTVYDRQLYLASLKTLLSFLCKNPIKENILIVGHNNGLSDLASYLLDDSISLPTGGFIGMSFPFDSSEEISQGTATKLFHFYPR